MTRCSYDAELNAALEEDAAKLRVMGGDPGPTLEDFGSDWIGCWQCNGEGTVYDCFEEYACIDPEGGCDLCGRRCSVCKGEGGWVATEDADATTPASDGEGETDREAGCSRPNPESPAGQPS